MEIRLLYRNEVQMAVYTAHEVFESCVRPYAKTTDEIDWYYSYVCVENLWQKMSTGQLFLWGAFEAGQMCAVSAIQDAGHITMLYVKPQYMKRHIGTQLIEQMCAYAAEQLHKPCVTVNVMPITAASFFYQMGFVLTQGAPVGHSYVPLERRIWAAPEMPERHEVTYPTKKVATKHIAWIAAAVLLFAAVMTVGLTVHHMAEEGEKTNTQKEEIHQTAFYSDFVINV